jgi:hypothetical protein
MRIIMMLVSAVSRADEENLLLLSLSPNPKLDPNKNVLLSLQ